MIALLRHYLLQGIYMSSKSFNFHLFWTPKLCGSIYDMFVPQSRYFGAMGKVIAENAPVAHTVTFDGLPATEKVIELWLPTVVSDPRPRIWPLIYAHLTPN